MIRKYHNSRQSHDTARYDTSKEEGEDQELIQSSTTPD